MEYICTINCFIVTIKITYGINSPAIFRYARFRLEFHGSSQTPFITQSTLSQSIRHTEEYLGVQLFERIGKKVYLTDAGSAFLPHAQKVMAEAEKGVQRIRIYKG
ncbi:MAG: LysR family transcriptional regulator [Bacteroides uniformis]|nr:LysR family transcriptional regulator [Bacteroides uniformis]